MTPLDYLRRLSWFPSQTDAAARPKTRVKFPFTGQSQPAPTTAEQSRAVGDPNRLIFDQLLIQSLRQNIDTSNLPILINLNALYDCSRVREFHLDHLGALELERIAPAQFPFLVFMLGMCAKLGVREMEGLLEYVEETAVDMRRELAQQVAYDDEIEGTGSLLSGHGDGDVQLKNDDGPVENDTQTSAYTDEADAGYEILMDME